MTVWHCIQLRITTICLPNLHSMYLANTIWCIYVFRVIMQLVYVISLLIVMQIVRWQLPCPQWDTPLSHTHSPVGIRLSAKLAVSLVKWEDFLVTSSSYVALFSANHYEVFQNQFFHLPVPLTAVYRDCANSTLSKILQWQERWTQNMTWAAIHCVTNTYQSIWASHSCSVLVHMHYEPWTVTADEKNFLQTPCTRHTSQLTHI